MEYKGQGQQWSVYIPANQLDGIDRELWFEA